MGTYFLKRLIIIIPSALFTVLLVFFLYDYSYTGQFDEDQGRLMSNNISIEQLEKMNCEVRTALHLDWPLFYFSIHPISISQDIRKICNEQYRQLIEDLCWQHSNSNLAIEMAGRLKILHYTGTIDQVRNVERILKATEIEEIHRAFRSLGESDKLISEYFKTYISTSRSWESFVPTMTWHGAENRFHSWLSGAITMDFGRSVLDRQPVTKKVHAALKNTLIFTLPGVLVIFGLSLILASVMRLKFKKSISSILYFVDTIPLFWLSILIILGFSNIPGMSWSFIAAITYSGNGDTGLWSILSQIPRHALPILALTLASIPYVTKQMESAFTQVRAKAYIETARAKGLNSKQIFSRHILKNSLVPISTIFFSFLAFAFGGAFVVEMVFSINGVGKLMADSVLANDLQVISVITLYLIVIKMIFTLINDIIAYMIDPSIQF